MTDTYRARWQDGDEGWRPIPSAAGYSASSLGRIRRDASLDPAGRRVPTSGKCLQPRIVNKRSGHWSVTLSCCGKPLHRLVHRLIAEAFLGPQPEHMPFVCHIDGNPHNNSAANLRWGNGTTNAADRTRHGRTLRGEHVGNSKLSASDVLAIRAASADGVSQREIARRFSVSQPNVAMIVSGKTWAHLP